jgi:release factor glutamine methyltransferase
LDFGTGSGCVAIALAVKSPKARVAALDISADALQLARENARRNGVVDRIEFVRGDGLSALTRDIRFNVIVANPPYIPSWEIKELQPEVRDYDPRVALDGGPDGLQFYRHLCAEAAERLKPGGRILLEFGDGQKEAVAELFDQENWVVESILEDYTQRPRILIARSTV